MTPGKFLFTRFTKPDGSSIATPFEVAEHMADSAMKCTGSTLWGVTVGKDDNSLIICYTGNGPTSEENAADIARACNAYGDLLAACEQARKYLEPDLVEPGRTVFWGLVSAIAKAEGR